MTSKFGASIKIDRLSFSDRLPTWVLMASATVVVFLCSPAMILMTRLVRSTKAATWVMLLPSARSHSQCPGNCRESSSFGRSLTAVASPMATRAPPYQVVSLARRIARRVLRCCESCVSCGCFVWWSASSGPDTYGCFPPAFVRNRFPFAHSKVS